LKVRGFDTQGSQGQVSLASEPTGEEASLLTHLKAKIAEVDALICRLDSAVKRLHRNLVSKNRDFISFFSKAADSCFGQSGIIDACVDKPIISLDQVISECLHRPKTILI